jgi:hypothetical protein
LRYFLIVALRTLHTPERTAATPKHFNGNNTGKAHSKNASERTAQAGKLPQTHPSNTTSTATSTTTSTTTPLVAPAPTNPGETAAKCIDDGLRLMNHNRLDAAREAFRQALDTRALNDIGRLVAYWHIFLTYRDNKASEGADALMSFIVIAEDVLREKSAEIRLAAERMNLKQRLQAARAMLSALWAQEVADYGRSALRPVLVNSEAEKLYFLQLAPPCGPDKNKHISDLPPVKTPDEIAKSKPKTTNRGAISASHSSNNTKSLTNRASIICEAAREGVIYYFAAPQLATYQ